MSRTFRLPMPSLTDAQRRLFDVLERNARRLYSDANAMFQAGSFATAKSLSILSIEESGKFWLLVFALNVEDQELAASLKKQLRSHSFKQIQSVLMLGGLAFHRAIGELASKSKSISEESLLFTHVAVKNNPEGYPGLVEASKTIERELAAIGEEWMRETGLVQLAERIRDKSVDADKQNGLYVDFDFESAEIINDPTLTTAAQAQEYLDLARLVLDCFLTD